MGKASRSDSADQTRPTDEPVAAVRAGPYEATPEGLVWHKTTRDGTVRTPLTNFTARIVADVAEDDGSGEPRRLFELEVALGGDTRRITVPGEKFATMNWATECLGARAIVSAGSSTKDRAREAIQRLSRDIAERRVYTHTGWRPLDAGWAYLHADGAIGASGPVPGVEVRLPDVLSRYQLPAPPTGEPLTAAIRASLRLLEAAPESITVPVLAAVYRAALGTADFGLHLAGPTGAGKSALAALAQQHFGTGMDSRHLPGAWSSTGNALEGLAFQAKDALLVVDDFAPTGTYRDVQRLQHEADRLLRAQGNNAGRQRMQADATLRATRSPRGLILSTGEDVPQGQSLRARLLVLELGPRDLRWERVTECQGDAEEGRYAQALAGFVRWLAPRYDEQHRWLRTRVAELRQEASGEGQHRRTPEIVAHLTAALDCFLDYAHEAGAISEAEARALRKRAWKALGGAAQAQHAHQATGDPAERFLELFRAALAAGRAHVAGADGHEPDMAPSWGWRMLDRAYDWRPQGDRVGWLDGEHLYLQPDASYAVAQRLARDQGQEFVLAPRTLHKRLSERELLVSTEGGRNTLTVRRTLEGARRSVLHLHAASILGDKPTDQPDQEADELCYPSSQAGQFVGQFDSELPEGLPSENAQETLAEQLRGQVGQVGSPQGAEAGKQYMVSEEEDDEWDEEPSGEEPSGLDDYDDDHEDLGEWWCACTRWLEQGSCNGCGDERPRAA
jgi:hypothetical protein